MREYLKLSCNPFQRIFSISKIELKPRKKNWKKETQKNCVICGAPFWAKSKNHILCGNPECKKRRDHESSSRHSERLKAKRNAEAMKGEVWVLDMETWQWHKENKM